jgi:hypothetical protein
MTVPAGAESRRWLGIGPQPGNSDGFLRIRRGATRWSVRGGLAGPQQEAGLEQTSVGRGTHMAGRQGRPSAARRADALGATETGASGKPGLARPRAVIHPSERSFPDGHRAARSTASDAKTVAPRRRSRRNRPRAIAPKPSCANGSQCAIGRRSPPSRRSTIERNTVWLSTLSKVMIAWPVRRRRRGLLRGHCLAG